jgi:ATP-dependent DNA ligase
MNSFVFPNKPIKIHTSNLRSISFGDWIVQPKFDGHRALPACDESGNITIFSRHGRPLSRAKGRKDIGKIDWPTPWLLDGEMTVDGRLIIWDLAVLGGVDFTRHPYLNRLKFLESLKDLSPGITIIKTLPASEYEKLFLDRSDSAVEGVVFKKKLATDLWGGTSTKEVASQLKLKF